MKTRTIAAAFVLCACVVVSAPLTAQTTSFLQWGLPGDVSLTADFDGDGRNELTVYRPSNGTWYIRYSSLAYSIATTAAYQWGLVGDVPIVGDYDGDKKADLIVWRPSNGTWYIRQSTSNFATFITVQWGLPGDVPAVGHFNGDGALDLAVYRPTIGGWFIRAVVDAAIPPPPPLPPPPPPPPPPPGPVLWTVSGSGATVFDMPTTIARVRIVGDYQGSCNNFIIYIGRNLVVNEILGTCSIGIGRHFEGTFLTSGGGVVQIQSSAGIAWSFTEVR